MIQYIIGKLHLLSHRFFVPTIRDQRLEEAFLVISSPLAQYPVKLVRSIRFGYTIMLFMGAVRGYVPILANSAVD